MSHSVRRTKLRLESLENRQLLAGDALSFSPSTDADLSASDGVSTVIEEFFSEETTFTQADAGSTRRTAARIGAVDGTRELSGSLGWLDQSDVIEFSVVRDGEANVLLSGLSRDADLYLTNASGNVIAQSTRSGQTNDAVSRQLDAGNYFVFVVAQSFWPSSYDLTIQTQLAPIVVAPITPAPFAGNPGVGETGSGTPASGGAPISSVSPLPDVAYFGGSREWNVNAINAPEAWAAGYLGQGVTVAVVDTGIDLDHPDLVTNLFVNPGEIPGNGIDDDGNGYIDDVSGYDFADNDNDANDVGGHGTHVAGTIAAGNNGFGATGIAPDATILPVRVLGANGSGSTRDVAAGIRYAADLGADIINLSLGGGYSRAIESAIEYAQSLGSLIVAAAGNESSASPGFPARFSANNGSVLSVGAFDSANRIAGFSNDVGTSGAVQVDAPGVGVFSTYVGGGYARLSGTSMAAPHVAGLAALTLSANPNLTAPELRNLITVGVSGNAVGSDSLGIVSASETVAYAAAGLTGADLVAQANIQQAPSNTPTAGFARATGIVEAGVPQVASVDLAGDLSLEEGVAGETPIAIGFGETLSRIASFDVVYQGATTLHEVAVDEVFAGEEITLDDVGDLLS